MISKFWRLKNPTLEATKMLEWHEQVTTLRVSTFLHQALEYCLVQYWMVYQIAQDSSAWYIRCNRTGAGSLLPY